MKYFEKLDLPVFGQGAVLSEFDKMINSNAVVPRYNQICINTAVGQEHNPHYGYGNLHYDWDAAEYNDAGEIISKPLRENPPDERDFCVVCDVFRGTIFEEIYNVLDKSFYLGRVRILTLTPKTCLSWHTDNYGTWSERVHYPFKTDEGCQMVIGDEVMHMPEDSWWRVDTTPFHTAFNASDTLRHHIVALSFGKK